MYVKKHTNTRYYIIWICIYITTAQLGSFPETSVFSQFKSISVSRYSYFSDRSSVNLSLNSLTNQDLENSDDGIPDILQPVLTNGLKLSSSNENLLLDPKYKAKKAVNFDINDVKEQGIVYHEPITPKPNNNNNPLPNSLSLNELLGNNSIKHNSTASLTMSQSISLFTESEKRRNSANFYRVWGKKASLAKLTPSKNGNLTDSQKSIFELTKLEDEEWTDEEALSQTDSDEDIKDDIIDTNNNNNDNNNNNSKPKHKKSRTLIMRRKTLTEQYTTPSSTDDTILETRNTGSLNSISHDE